MAGRYRTVTGGLLVLALLGGCQGVKARQAAGEDVHAFLQAASTGDTATFDAHVDRPALRRQVEEAMLGSVPESRKAEVKRMLAGPQGKTMVDKAISPGSFRLATQGDDEAEVPSALRLGAMLRPAGDDRLCLPAGGGDCAMTFANEDGTWKLIAIPAPQVSTRFETHKAPG